MISGLWLMIDLVQRSRKRQAPPRGLDLTSLARSLIGAPVNLGLLMEWRPTTLPGRQLRDCSWIYVHYRVTLVKRCCL